MIPLTEDELAALLRARDILADKGIGTGVMVLNMILNLAQQTAGELENPCSTTELENPSK